MYNILIFLCLNVMEISITVKFENGRATETWNMSILSSKEKHRKLLQYHNSSYGFPKKISNYHARQQYFNLYYQCTRSSHHESWFCYPLIHQIDRNDRFVIIQLHPVPLVYPILLQSISVSTLIFYFQLKFP